jgi:glucose-6-phosphate 1-epimerase
MTTFPFPDNFPSKNIQLKSPDGGVVLISPYGAHVLSWVPAGGDERLFLSPKAEFRAGAAIRGGVPVIFPQFAEMGNLPKHGFARTLPWEVARVSADSAVFWLSENEATWKVWQHRFLAEYMVHCSEGRLEMMLSITNTDIAPFSFTTALHTYLKVKNAAESSVVGVKGLIYRDSANGGKELREDPEQVVFQGEVDRIYLDVPESIQLIDDEQNMVIRAKGFTDAVIWNPGPEKCARLVDMEPDGYLRFVCVEAAALAQPVQLAPGENWRGSQMLSI